MTSDANGGPDRPEQQPKINRRRVLGGGAVAAGVLWAAPAINSRPALAQGGGSPAPFGLVAIQNDQRTTLGDLTVGGLDLGGNAQIAYTFTRLTGSDNITVAPLPGTGAPWTLLINRFHSTVTTPAVGPSPATTARRLRLSVWYRIGALTSNITFDQNGTTGLNGSWRAGVAEFAGVTSIAASPGGALAVGGGTDGNVVPGPAVSSAATQALAFFAGAKGSLGSLSSTPAGYVLEDFNSTQPAYAAFCRDPSVGGAPATSFSLSGTATQRVGFQVMVEG